MYDAGAKPPTKVTRRLKGVRFHRADRGKITVYLDYSPLDTVYHSQLAAHALAPHATKHSDLRRTLLDSQCYGIWTRAASSVRLL